MLRAMSAALSEPVLASPPRPSSAPWRIAVVSSIVLVLELAFIRQIPAEVRVISYFTNLVLMAAFFGLGLGCILQGRRIPSWLFPLGVGLTFLFVYYARGIVVYDQDTAVHYWLQYTEVQGQARQVPLLPAALAAFLAASLPFVSLGQVLAQQMDEHPRTVAYGWDIAGSLLGTLAFTASSFLGLPPWVWVTAIMVAWAFLFERTWGRRLPVLAAGAVFGLLGHSPHPARWSPYYFIQYEREPIGLRVWVNSSFHQLAIDFTDKGNPEVRRLMRAKWGVPYHAYKSLHGGAAPRKVLVLGAGTGNDVVMALENGAEQVVAVEIDPVILKLGRELNPSAPYADGRVHAIVDDARHYLRTSPERFDLIVFGTLDSQSLLSGHANLRLENYVYTREALADARRLLNEGGMAVLHYSIFRPWIYARIFSTVRAAFGEECLLLREDSAALFNTTILAGRGLPIRADAETVALFGRALPASDDWPFVYLERPTIAPVYLQILSFVVLLVFGAFLLVRRLHPGTGGHLDFLALGLGFSLMESAAVVRFALLFGSTWVVNAVVFSSVLAMIFVANLVVQRGRAPAIGVSFVLLWLAVLANYFFPLDVLFATGALTRAVVSGLLVGSPVFFAGLCFSGLFRAQKTTGYPLGMNLVGAMGGGVLEYASMLTGMRAVWLMVLVLYLIAGLASRRAAAAAGH
jgi:SAM-dependent methyltransferase